MNVKKKMNNKQVKNIIEPFLQNDEKITEWDSISDGFLLYQNNPQILIDIIKKLNLKNSEEIISRLPEIHDTFFEELSESYVLGESKDVGNKLIEENNTLFIEKINYYKTLSSVITKIERKRMIDEFKAEDAISDESIKLAFKREGRDEMNAKFRQWDKELKEKKINKPKGKLISLLTTRVAIAASVSLLIGFSLFKTFYTANSFTINVLTQSQMGYVGNKPTKEIKIIFNDNLIENNNEEQYTFFNNTLLIFDLKSEELFYFIELESNHFYIQYNKEFYQIKETESPILLIKETDNNIKEQLEKIIFENE